MKVQKLHHKINNIRTDYIHKIIAKIVKTNPSYIMTEDLNVSDMMKNRHLSKAVADRIYKCKYSYIEDRDFNVSLNLRDVVTYEVA